MGATLSDIHRNMYGKYRMQGMTHEKAMSQFPEPMRKRVEKELEMTAFESHFGSWKSVLIITGVILVIMGILIFLGYKFGW